MTSPAIILLDRAAGAPVSLPQGGTTLGAADPFAAGREIAWMGPSDASAGRVAFAGTIHIASFPHIETMIVLAGRLVLTVAGQKSLVVTPGLGVTVARGTGLHVEADAGTRWAFFAATGRASAQPGLTAHAADVPLSPSSPPPAEFLRGPMPQCRSFNAFTDEATRFRAGTWDSSPYDRVLREHRVNELTHVLEGSVDLTGPDGTVTRVGTGDTVFVAKGAPCAWDSRVHVAKIYVVQEIDG